LAVSEQETNAPSRTEETAPEVPDFDLIRSIGSGGFGEVWLARNRATGRLRAVKLIPLSSSSRGDPAAREIGSITRLEANSRCRHPNLLQIHHVGKTAQYLFYVMDPADDLSGGPASDKPTYQPATLQSKLAGGPLPPDRCWEYSRQLLEGLAMLHAAGMVHRDVKPGNCLFVGGQLKLGDFGLLTEAHPLVSRVGTQKYMPPDGRMDRRADVYAAGLVIYEMLSGLPVDEFPRLGARSQDVRDDPSLAALLRLVLRACERESENRPADARVMLAELMAPVEANPRRWRPLTVVVCAALLAVAAVGGFMLFGKIGGDAGGVEGAAGVRPQSEVPVPMSPARVDVSFVTDPFEATIYLDGELLRDPESPAKKPYTTPCTVPGLTARKCRVAFMHNGRRWEAEDSPYDLAKTQQIVSRKP
jgi:hypothetical protein